MLLRTTANYDLFRAYVRNLITPAVRRFDHLRWRSLIPQVTAIGWNTTGPQETRLLRMTLLGTAPQYDSSSARRADFAVRFEVTNARDAARAMFDA